MNEKKKRNPLEKESFLEGIRQKWAAIFTAIGLLIMALSALHLIHDPTPYFGYFTGIGVTFILGASASAVMGAYKINSSSSEQLTTEKVERKEEITKNINIKEERLLTIKRLDPKDLDEEAF
jgi:hypothetical protein